MHQGTFCICEEWLNFLHLGVFERTFLWNYFDNNNIFFYLSPTLIHLHQLQVENCESDSRLVEKCSHFVRVFQSSITAPPPLHAMKNVFICFPYSNDPISGSFGMQITYYTNIRPIYKQEAQGPWRLSTALQKIRCKCVRECISIL